MSATANPGTQKSRPQVVRRLSPLRAAVERARRGSRTVALVPTMGALHAGHLALVRVARRRADRVVVSIFVNPTQFAPNEDYQSYPRTWTADIAALAREEVDLVWAPSVSVMYPPGFATTVVPGGAATVGLEDRFRPHFFNGVCTVVAKLLLQVQPDVAIFGEKDYQQLKVVSAMTRDLNIPVKIIGAATVRESDGLALSSRNAYLSREERAIAPILYRVLRESAKRLRAGDAMVSVLASGRDEIQRAGFMVDYFEARHAETLVPIQSLADGPARLLVAARIGRTRLIDNIAI